jgi:non-canonical (house-cleaning) NTP pyrophosphatase
MVPHHARTLLTYGCVALPAGIELGFATDKVFKKHNSKQAGGCIGSLTNCMITRESYYHQPLIMALLPFINHDMYAE